MFTKKLKNEQKIPKCQFRNVLTSFLVRKHPKAGQRTQQLTVFGEFMYNKS
jgi:hypothetical protein